MVKSNEDANALANTNQKKFFNGSSKKSRDIKQVDATSKMINILQDSIEESHFN
ncbi:MAG: hypothetical protein PF569_10290 [Candidatus Woesearchaeota archaeon]|jgi:Cu/Ag efflux protein CusF|nr:hypothetical protein [Candidatus Woesearchaeota archaeon]